MGDPLDPNTHIGPLARQDIQQEIQRQVEKSKEKGAQVI